jgi:hypothetical protein
VENQISPWFSFCTKDLCFPVVGLLLLKHLTGIIVNSQHGCVEETRTWKRESSRWRLDQEESSSSGQDKSSLFSKCQGEMSPGEKLQKKKTVCFHNAISCTHQLEEKKLHHP